MGPLRGNKKKRKVDENPEENSAISGISEKGSGDWWDALSKKINGDPSSSNGLDEFKSTFQMSKSTFDYICSLVKDQMTAKSHFSFSNGKPMSLTDQVALALRRLGSGNSLISIGDSFGAHHSTVSQVTWRFVEAIEESGLRHLRWPDQEEMSGLKCNFEKIGGLPNCCGAIDTTHVRMLLTSSDQEADTWLDREKNHSMVIQAIVGPDMKFLDIVTGWPGKLDDSTILRGSTFFKLCEKNERLNGENVALSDGTKVREYIVGDSGFPLLPWLVTPYRVKEELSGAKLEFNKRVRTSHGVSRRALARLKDVWRMIRGDMWRPDRHKLPRFILVCCVLHNIVIDMEGGDFDGVESSFDHDPGYRQEVCESVDKSGSILRDEMALYLAKELRS